MQLAIISHVNGQTFGLRRTPEDGLVLFRKCGSLDKANNLIPCLDMPTPSTQGDSTWSEGPGSIYIKDVAGWLSADEVFFFLRAQIIFERIQKRFPVLKSFVPLKNEGIILICLGLLTARARNEVANSILGVYQRDRIFFCAGENCFDKSSEQLPKLQEALLNETVPSGFEIVCGDDTMWSTEYPEI